ncbi:putative nuclease HARBI1 [Heterodontus francisci]|uniref:putative nuclease HARBI1 n=1 Tax=Heterodontus francisci TaxID=7792 RepID=UPI00355BFD5C
MSCEMVTEISRILRHDLQPRGFCGNPMPVAVKLIAALSYFASGSFQGSTGNICGISQSATHRCIKEVTLFRHVTDFIHLPVDEDGQAAWSAAFGAIAGFPRVQGVINCTHAAIRAPWDQPAAFVNRKGFHFLNCYDQGRKYFRISEVSKSRIVRCHSKFLGEINEKSKVGRHSRQFVCSRCHTDLPAKGVTTGLLGFLSSNPKVETFLRLQELPKNITMQQASHLRRRIMHACARFPGSCHDSHILRNSQLPAIFEEPAKVDGWIPGDKGYPLCTWLMIPGRHPQSTTEEKCNVAHASTRAIIEHTIGMLKMCFHCLDWSGRTVQYAPQRVSPIIVVCCALHNLAIRCGNILQVEKQEEQLSSSDEDDYEEQEDNNDNNAIMAMRAMKRHATDIRENLIYACFIQQ